jgi:hypothetical protein
MLLFWLILQFRRNELLFERRKSPSGCLCELLLRNFGARTKCSKSICSKSKCPPPPKHWIQNRFLTFRYFEHRCFEHFCFIHFNLGRYGLGHFHFGQFCFRTFFPSAPISLHDTSPRKCWQFC